MPITIWLLGGTNVAADDNGKIVDDGTSYTITGFTIDQGYFAKVRMMDRISDNGSGNICGQ